jgi:hypothetical protein
VIGHIIYGQHGSVDGAANTEYYDRAWRWEKTGGSTEIVSILNSTKDGCVWAFFPHIRAHPFQRVQFRAFQVAAVTNLTSHAAHRASQRATVRTRCLSDGVKMVR